MLRNSRPLTDVWGEGPAFYAPTSRLKIATEAGLYWLRCAGGCSVDSPQRHADKMCRGHL